MKIIKSLVMMSICLMLFTTTIQSQGVVELPSHTWLAQNWELVALIASEALALIPTNKKIGGILRATWSIFVYVFKPKKK